MPIVFRPYRFQQPDLTGLLPGNKMTGPTMGETLPHHPVLYHEIIHALRPKRGGFYVDGTLGAGGHALGILEASAPDGRLLGLDVDPQALQLARQRLAPFGARVL